MKTKPATTIIEIESTAPTTPELRVKDLPNGFFYGVITSPTMGTYLSHPCLSHHKELNEPQLFLKCTNKDNLYIILCSDADAVWSHIGCCLVTQYAPVSKIKATIEGQK